jgi:pimeloyl-ACP methyl ester carboxylesterase
MFHPNLKRHGNPPFCICVVHGGPGAAGEMAPVASELASDAGILEPFQTADSIQGQIEELRDVLKSSGNPPIILIGFSWGAWLSYFLAVHHPVLVQKLILVSSGPFEEKYARNIQKIRMNRLDEEKRREVEFLMKQIEDSEVDDKNKLFGRFGDLISQADAYDPVNVESEKLECRYDVFQKVWPEADALRKSGKLLNLGEKIRCPVVAIHGDYDPHPAEGVRIPLSRVIHDFRFVLLEKCGHKPWIERLAMERFYQILKEEIVL